MKFYIYFVVVSLTLLWLLFTYRKNFIYIFIILLFYHGLFTFFGKASEDFYKILMAGMSVMVFFRYKLFHSVKTSDKYILTFFLLFSASFYLSSFINSDKWTMVLSQYFSKYFLLMISYFLFKYIYYSKPEYFRPVSKLIFTLIVVQIILSLLKSALFVLHEGIVGSISSSGGALAATFPAYAIMIIWLYRKGKFNKNDWITLAGIFFIGFSSNKRAIWFILPLVLFYIFTYLQHKNILKPLIYIFPLIPLLLYIGVRLNPTLNPERKIWGSFDANYSMDYVVEYSFGEENIKNAEVPAGRFSGTFSLFNKLFNSDLDKEDFWGIGQEAVRSTDYAEFLDLNTGLASKAALTGFYKTYLNFGFVGTFLLLLLFISFLRKTKDKRFKILLFLFAGWDFFFYHGTSLDSTIAMVILVYVIWYSNFILIKNKIAFKYKINNAKKYSFIRYSV